MQPGSSHIGLSALILHIPSKIEMMIMSFSSRGETFVEVGFGYILDFLHFVHLSHAEHFGT